MPSWRSAPKDGSARCFNSPPDICGNTRSKSAPPASAPSRIPAPLRRRRVMRTSEVLLGAGLLALAFGLSPAVSFDGRPEVVPMPNAAGPSTPQMNNLGNATPLVAVPVTPMVPPRSLGPSTPFEAFRSGTQALRQGRTDQAVLEL